MISLQNSTPTSKKRLETIIERRIAEKKKDITIDMVTVVGIPLIVNAITTNIDNSFCKNSIEFAGGLCFTYQLNKTFNDFKNLKDLNKIKQSTSNIPANIIQIH